MMRVAPAMRNDMKLIREYYELCDGGICQDLLTEAEKREVAEGAIYLTGVMQKCNTKNANGRIYERKTLFREIDKYKQLVKEKRALGELDHPDSSVISLERCSHMVTNIWTEGDAVMGKIKVLQELPMVEDDFQLICFDMVSDPSTPGAFMLREAREMVKENITMNKVTRIIDEMLQKYEV